jgi:hypothetical protein
MTDRPIASIILDKLNGVEAPLTSKAKSKTLGGTVMTMTEADTQRKTELLNALRVGTWVVEFTKVDGTPATMECTLDGRQIPHNPEEINPTLQDHRPSPEHLIRAFSTDRNGWRSFAVPNVQKFYKKIDSI